MKLIYSKFHFELVKIFDLDFLNRKICVAFIKFFLRFSNLLGNLRALNFYTGHKFVNSYQQSLYQIWDDYGQRLPSKDE